jgi:hypothetical protein
MLVKLVGSPRMCLLNSVSRSVDPVHFLCFLSSLRKAVCWAFENRDRHCSSSPALSCISVLSEPRDGEGGSLEDVRLEATIFFESLRRYAAIDGRFGRKCRGLLAEMVCCGQLTLFRYVLIVLRTRTHPAASQFHPSCS